jgi:hypothetical protein
MDRDDGIADDKYPPQARQANLKWSEKILTRWLCAL